MGSNLFVSHTGSDGSQPVDRVRRQQFKWNAGVIAENILHEAIRFMGVGLHVTGDGGAWYWTQVFADSTIETCSA